MKEFVKITVSTEQSEIGTLFIEESGIMLNNESLNIQDAIRWIGIADNLKDVITSYVKSIVNSTVNNMINKH